VIEEDHPQANPPEQIQADIPFNSAQAGQDIPIGHRYSTLLHRLLRQPFLRPGTISTRLAASVNGGFRSHTPDPAVIPNSLSVKTEAPPPSVEQTAFRSIFVDGLDGMLGASAHLE
jgi:hypothetical protein